MQNRLPKVARQEENVIPLCYRNTGLPRWNRSFLETKPRNTSFPSFDALATKAPPNFAFSREHQPRILIPFPQYLPRGVVEPRQRALISLYALRPLKSREEFHPYYIVTSTSTSRRSLLLASFNYPTL